MPQVRELRLRWTLVLGAVGLLLLLAWALAGASASEAEPGDRLGRRIYITRSTEDPGEPMLPPVQPDRLVPPDPQSQPSRLQLATEVGTPARFFVTYHGFPLEAQQAMQAAVQVWASRLSSPVPIRIDAYWEDLGRGVLGASGPNDFIRNGPGAPVTGIYYPSALANRFARKDIDPSAADMTVLLNSTGVRWYYGTDGQPPVAHYDLFTVALHEVSHGLGIADSGDYDYTDDGYAGLFAGPTILDSLLYSDDGKQLIATQYPSTALYDLFTSGRLFFDGPATRSAAGGARPRVFAPVVLFEGSSLSHLDESTYPDGDPNALLTPIFAPREAIHEPGPVLLGLLADIGWGATVGPSLETPTATATSYANRRFAPQVASDGRRLTTPTPVPVSTKPPMPAPTTTATPYPGMPPVGIRKATWRIDENGYLWVAGEAVNNGTQPIGYVTVGITYYDHLGNRIGSSLATTPLPVIPPGTDAPFRGGSSKPPAGIVRVTLAIAYVEPPEPYMPPSNLEVTVTSRTLSAIGVLHIRGTVKNTSATQTWRSIIPYVALYDIYGAMLRVDSILVAPTSLAPGETGMFDWAINLPPPADTIGATRTWIAALE